ncbi:LLM class flavin-dependent oxidoreductase [Hoeflea sp. CAU 1731]
MIPYSILDLAPVPEGSSVEDALRNSIDLARHAEKLGYNRYWLAEHHNMPGIASAATSVLIGQIAGDTTSMRVGSGGVMLPNHAPLVIAEQFGTLATLFPGRVDLGLGRAPGTDMPTARALRRNLDGGDNFPQDVVELMAYFSDEAQNFSVRAIPGAGTRVPIWILGSSTYGAQLAAHLGLPYSFASHFAPAALDVALEIYRDTFKPSQQLEKPYFMLAMNVFAADTDEEGQFLHSTMLQAFANLRSGRPGKLPRPAKDLHERYDRAILESASQALSFSAVGSAATVRDRIRSVIDRYQPDEIIFTGQIHDHAARLKSFELASGVMGALEPA